MPMAKVIVLFIKFARWFVENFPAQQHSSGRSKMYARFHFLKRIHN